MANRPPSDGIHVIVDGEWVGSVAMHYGFSDWNKEVWQLPQNASLRQKRPDPHVLGVGDKLFIPPWQEKVVDCPVAKRHRFELKVPTEVLRLRLLGEDAKPIKDEEYKLEIEHEPGGGTFKQAHSKTDGEGVLTEDVPSTARSGLLRLPRLHQHIELRIGFLTPLDLDDPEKLIRGAQERLASLGFDPGLIDGVDGARTQAAVAAFQEFCRLNKGQADPSVIDAGPVNGVVDTVTKKALMSYYGC
jgi:hypothetical protein